MTNYAWDNSKTEIESISINQKSEFKNWNEGKVDIVIKTCIPASMKHNILTSRFIKFGTNKGKMILT